MRGITIMTCPYCKEPSLVGAKICTHCGAVLRPTAEAKKKLPKAHSRRGSIRRIVFALVAAVICGAIGYFVLGTDGEESSNRPLLGIALAVSGAFVAYLGLGLGLYARRAVARGKVQALSSAVSHSLKGAEERYRKSLKDDADPEPHTRLALADVHLLRGEVPESLGEYEAVRAQGLSDPSALNNFAVALVQHADIPRAIDAFESTRQNGATALAPTENYAHLLTQVRGAIPDDWERRAESLIEECLRREPDGKVHFQRKGLVLIGSGRYEEAIRQFESALKQNLSKTDQADVQNNLGVAKYLAGDFRGAMAHFQTALRLDFGHARSLSNLSVCQAALGRPGEALEAAERAVAIDPSSPECQNNLGYALYLNGFPNHSIGAFRRAADVGATAFEPQYNLGKIYTDERIADHAERHLRRANDLFSKSWQVMVASAVLKMNRGEFTDALKELQPALALAPDSSIVNYDLGIALGSLGRFEEASVKLETAYKQEPKDPELCGQIGWLMFQREEYKRAADILRHAIDLDPKNPRLQDYFGLSQLALGAMDVAEIHFKRAHSMDKSYTPVLYHLGYLAAMRKDLSGAIKQWVQAKQHEPKYADLRTNLGVAYYLTKKFGEAIEEFRQVLAVRQDRMEDASNLAMAYALQGLSIHETAKKQGDRRSQKAMDLFKLAVKLFDQALLIRPDNVVLHSNRGLACFYADRPEESVQEWALVSRLDPDYARRRGELLTTAFDESAVEFIPLKGTDRVTPFAARTASCLPRLATGYATERWELILSDDKLAKVQKQQEELARAQRQLHALSN